LIPIDFVFGNALTGESRDLAAQDGKDTDMSAYVVVEATVRDEEARDRYGPQIGPLLKEYGGEILAFGPWQLIFGEPAYRNGMIIRFPDKDTALGWYNSPAYQALLDIRDAALDCRFRLVG
jgi:uncharacterized protein (DUF1330 family)